MENPLNVKLLNDEKEEEEKRKNIEAENDEIAIGFDAKTLWQICGLNV